MTYVLFPVDMILKDQFPIQIRRKVYRTSRDLAFWIYLKELKHGKLGLSNFEPINLNRARNWRLPFILESGLFPPSSFKAELTSFVLLDHLRNLFDSLDKATFSLFSLLNLLTSCWICEIPSWPTCCKLDLLIKLPNSFWIHNYQINISDFECIFH